MLDKVWEVLVAAIKKLLKLILLGLVLLIGMAWLIGSMVGESESTKPSAPAPVVEPQPKIDPAVERANARAKLFKDVESATADLNEISSSTMSKTPNGNGPAVVFLTFDISARAIQRASAEQPLSEDEMSKVKTLNQTLVRKQKEMLPLMRAATVKDMANKLWEDNIEVVGSGTGSRKITFIGALFASNKNISTFYRELSPDLNLLRFQRMGFKWIPSADESYYDLENPGDEVVAVAAPESGKLETIDTKWIR